MTMKLVSPKPKSKIVAKPIDGTLGLSNPAINPINMVSVHVFCSANTVTVDHRYCAANLRSLFDILGVPLTQEFG